MLQKWINREVMTSVNESYVLAIYLTADHSIILPPRCPRDGGRRCSRVPRTHVPQFTALSPVIILNNML